MAGYGIASYVLFGCAAASIANAFTKNSLKHLLKVKEHRAVFVAKLGEVVP